MSLDALLYFAETTIVVYSLLVTAYFTTGWVYFCNDPTRVDKIQPGRTLPAEKVRRDIRQSARSLLSIAMMFSVGHTLYGRFHFGLAAWQPSVWSVVLSFFISMLLYDILCNLVFKTSKLGFS